MSPARSPSAALPQKVSTKLVYVGSGSLGVPGVVAPDETVVFDLRLDSITKPAVSESGSGSV